VAFTLIELLVVIAVVVILASLLSPALGKAKQKAQMVKCLGNLHQIGFGIKLYMDDNRDTFPPAVVSQFNPAIPPNSPMDYIHSNWLSGNDPLPGFDPGDAPPATNRLVNPYVRARETWHCPADRGIFGLQPRVSALSEMTTASIATCLVTTMGLNLPRILCTILG